MQSPQLPRNASPDPRLVILASCALFRYVGAGELVALGADVAVIEVAKGSQILRPLTTGASIYCVVDGMVLANQFSSLGREVGYRRLGPGSYFGEIAAIDGLPRSVNVSALTAVRLARLPGPTVRALLERSLGFNRALREDLAAIVRDLSGRLLDVNALSAGCRLQIEILRMASQAGVKGNNVTIAKAPTHAETAALIGTHREAVTREYNRLEATGLISRVGRQLIVHDITRLENAINQAGGSGFNNLAPEKEYET